MTSPLRGRFAPRVALLLSLALPSAAQSTAASESGVVLAQGTAASGGASIGSVTGGQTSSSVGQPATGSIATSSNYIVHTGVALQIPAYSGNQPLVTGIREGFSPSGGGDVVSVFGFRFTAPGAGVTTGSLGGAFAPTTVVSSTKIDLTPPAGTGPLGNALTELEVEIDNAHGSSAVPAALSYTPALLAANAPQLGEHFKLRVHGEAGGFFVLVFGKSVPGFGISVSPFGGQLETVLNLLVLSPSLQPLPNGYGDTVIDMPSNPPLAGVTMEFQAIVFDDATFATGAWTNRLASPILP